MLTNVHKPALLRGPAASLPGGKTSKPGPQDKAGHTARLNIWSLFSANNIPFFGNKDVLPGF